MGAMARWNGRGGSTRDRENHLAIIGQKDGPQRPSRSQGRGGQEKAPILTAADRRKLDALKRADIARGTHVITVSAPAVNGHLGAHLGAPPARISPATAFARALVCAGISRKRAKALVEFAADLGVRRGTRRQLIAAIDAAVAT